MLFNLFVLWLIAAIVISLALAAIVWFAYKLIENIFKKKDIY